MQNGDGFGRVLGQSHVPSVCAQLKWRYPYVAGASDSPNQLPALPVAYHWCSQPPRPSHPQALAVRPGPAIQPPRVSTQHTNSQPTFTWACNSKAVTSIQGKPPQPPTEAAVGLAVARPPWHACLDWASWLLLNLLTQTADGGPHGHGGRSAAGGREGRRGGRVNMRRVAQEAARVGGSRWGHNHSQPGAQVC